MVVIIAIAGLVIDLGNVERVRAQMQIAADAAATSGASTLLDFQSNVTVAENTARRFGMAADGINQVTGVDTSTVSQSVSVECDNEYSGCGSTTPNTVAVHETAAVPTYFLSIFGIDSIDVSTEAEACAPCQSHPTRHHAGARPHRFDGRGREVLEQPQTCARSTTSKPLFCRDF